VFVTLQINVQFKVIHGQERAAFYALENYEKQINSYVFDTVRSAVPKINLDKVFEQKEDIANAVKQELSKCMQAYGWEIIQVLIADIEPDPKVKNAMNEINTAQRLRVATVDKAEADKILVVKMPRQTLNPNTLVVLVSLVSVRLSLRVCVIPLWLSPRRYPNPAPRRSWILCLSHSTSIPLRKSVRSLALLPSSFLRAVIAVLMQLLVFVRVCSKLMPAWPVRHRPVQWLLRSVSKYERVH